jgi:hypothetical protein
VHLQILIRSYACMQFPHTPRCPRLLFFLREPLLHNHICSSILTFSKQTNKQTIKHSFIHSSTHLALQFSQGSRFANPSRHLSQAFSHIKHIQSPSEHNNSNPTNRSIAKSLQTSIKRVHFLKVSTTDRPR